MPTYVSTRVETSKQSKGQAEHDCEDRPGYANKKKKHLNKTIFGGSEENIKNRIDVQARDIKNRYNKQMVANKQALKSGGATAKELRACGGWRTSTATHWKAIITFGGDFGSRDKPDRKLDRDKLDACAKNHFEAFCKKHGCELTYIVRHDDEATVHYHAMFTNLGYKREPLDKKEKYNRATEKFDQSRVGPLRFEMRHLSALQDDVGDQFASLGMVRGKLRNARLEQARNENPQLKDESEKDYSNRIYKIANVKNRTTSESHDTQERDFALQIAELENTLNDLSTKHDKIQKNISVAELKLESLNSVEISVTAKIEKNLGVYSRRKEGAELEYVKKLDQLNAMKQEIESLTITPIKTDITSVYEVVTGRGMLKNATEKMNLVDPETYNVRAKNLVAHSKKNMSDHHERERIIRAREDNLEKNEELQLIRTKKLNGLERSIPEKIRTGISDYIRCKSDELVVSIKAATKARLKTETSLGDDDIDTQLKGLSM